jgi:hypothetical protein
MLSETILVFLSPGASSDLRFLIWFPNSDDLRGRRKCGVARRGLKKWGCERRALKKWGWERRGLRKKFLLSFSALMDRKKWSLGDFRDLRKWGSACGLDRSERRKCDRISSSSFDLLEKLDIQKRQILDFRTDLILICLYLRALR